MYMNEKAPIDAALAVPGRLPVRPPKRSTSRNIVVPIDHHPGTVRGEGPSAQSARAAMIALHDAWTRIAEAAEGNNIDPPRLAKAAQSAMERALTAADRATSTIDGRVKDLEAAVTAAIQPRVDPTLAAEVRAYWRARGWANGMTEAMRGDVRTASAILSAPGYLSGLDPDQFATMHRIAVDAHAGEQQAALDEALRARRKVETAGARMMELIAPRLREWAEADSESLTRLEALGRG